MIESFEAFTRRAEGFERLSPSDKICLAVWYLHTIQGVEHVSTSHVNSLFSEIHESAPHTSVYLKRMAERRPPLLLKGKQGYRLERKPRAALDIKYAERPNSILVSKLLSSLSEKMTSSEEAKFLEETLRCYSVLAFRAAIVMAWNLAYDHLLKWILSDSVRLDSFNASLAAKYPKKAIVTKNFDDFSEFKEFEIVETVQHAKLITKNIGDILREKLKRRNAAAHPSNVIITQAQADDVITDLVNNIILKLG